MSDQPLTFAELAEHFRVSPRHARRIAKKLALSVMDLGHRTKRIRPADLDRAEQRAADAGQTLERKPRKKYTKKG